MVDDAPVTDSTPTEVQLFETAPKEFDKALGVLTRRFGQIEHLMAVIIKRATGKRWDDVFSRLNGDLRDRKKNGDLRDREKLISEVRKSLKVWLNQEFDAAEATRRLGSFDKIRNGLKNALDRRDELTHCAWGVGKGGLKATRHGSPLLIAGLPACQTHVVEAADNLLDCLEKMNKLIPRVRDDEVREPSSTVDIAYGSSSIVDVSAAS